MSLTYDPAVEREDVALRGLWRLCHRIQGGRALLAELGVSEEGVEALVCAAYPRTQQQVFALFARCPQLLDAVEESLRRYIQETWQARFAYYAQKEGTTDQ